MNFLLRINLSNKSPKETGAVCPLFNVCSCCCHWHWHCCCCCTWHSSVLLYLIHVFHTCTLNFCAPIADNDATRRGATLLKGISGDGQRRQEAYAHALVANCRRRVVEGNVILSCRLIMLSAGNKIEATIELQLKKRCAKRIWTLT